MVGGGVGCVLGVDIGRGGRCVGAGFYHISIFLGVGFGGRELLPAQTRPEGPRGCGSLHPPEPAGRLYKSIHMLHSW